MKRTHLAKAVFTLSILTCAGSASAQGLTAEEKFKQMLDDGVFEGSVEGALAKEMTRAEYAAILGRILGLDREEPAPDDFTKRYDDFVNRYNRALSNSDPFDDSGELDKEDLMAALAAGLKGNTSPLAGSGSFSDWVRQYGSVDLPDEATRKQQEQLVKDLFDWLDGKDPDEDDQWADYPYYASGNRTAVLPASNADFLDGGRATYNGRVAGTDAAGNALSGTSTFELNFDWGSAEMNGTFDFTSGDVVHLGGIDVNGEMSMWVWDGAFQGGTIVTNSHEIDAGFYGPKAEEFGGDWSFDVNGGTAPGTVSGEFATKR